MTGAEQRAKGIVDSSLATAGGNPKFRADLVSAITTAILEAENAKLEEAARDVSIVASGVRGKAIEWREGMQFAETVIRSLIEKD